MSCFYLPQDFSELLIDSENPQVGDIYSWIARCIWHRLLSLQDISLAALWLVDCLLPLGIRSHVLSSCHSLSDHPENSWNSFLFQKLFLFMDSEKGGGRCELLFIENWVTDSLDLTYETVTVCFPEELLSLVLKQGDEVSFPFCQLRKYSWARNKLENLVCKGCNVNDPVTKFKPGGKV